MPAVKGLELQRQLTEQGYPLPIIFITALAGTKARAESGGRSAWFLTKPFQ
jgi:FixJ family two-component response regulator